MRTLFIGWAAAGLLLATDSDAYATATPKSEYIGPYQEQFPDAPLYFGSKVFDHWGKAGQLPNTDSPPPSETLTGTILDDGTPGDGSPAGGTNGTSNSTGGFDGTGAPGSSPPGDSGANGGTAGGPNGSVNPACQDSDCTPG